MTPEREAAIKAALKEDQALGLTMFAEAAGDKAEGGSSVEERLAVGCVVRNRVLNRRWPKTFAGVCLQRLQFSCWNAGLDANHVRLMALAERLITAGESDADALVKETLFLARGIISGTILDRTGGATCYYAPKAMIPAGAKPSWVFVNGKDGQEHVPVAVVGTQVFYKL